MAKKIRVWDGSAWQDVAPALPYTAIHSAQASMPATGIDGQVWLDTDGTLSDTAFVPLSTIDAKGDLLVGTADNTASRLAVSTDQGANLVVDSSTSTGLRWQEPKNQNPVLNSAFQIWQRNTSVSSTTDQFVADRWYSRIGANCTVSRQATGDTTNLPFIQYCMRMQRNSGSTSTTTVTLLQSFETINTIPFVGKTVTLSFYARRGSNYSNSGNNLNVYLATGTGTDQGFQSGYTGAAYPINSSCTLTTTWQRFTFTGTLATTANEMTIFVEYGPSGTAGAADYFEITGVQLEYGSVATPFRTYASTIAGELAACMRYFQKIEFLSLLHARQTTQLESGIMFPVVMRVPPTLTAISAWNVYDAFGSGFTQSSPDVGLSVTGANTKGAFFGLGNFTGLTQGRTYITNAAGQGAFTLSSEL